MYVSIYSFNIPIYAPGAIASWLTGRPSVERGLEKVNPRALWENINEFHIIPMILYIERVYYLLIYEPLESPGNVASQSPRLDTPN